MEKSCETCRHDTPGYVSIIGTHDHCCEKHYHCRPGSVALDYSPKDAKVCGTCNSGMRIGIKRPGNNWTTITCTNDLKLLQDLVGGYIETVTLANGCVLICNEYGRIRGLEPNCTICGIDFVGTVLVAGISGEEFCSVPQIGYHIIKNATKERK